LICRSLAAVGRRLTACEVAEPPVMPLAADGGWLGCGVGGLRLPAAWCGRCDGLARLGGAPSGEVTVTGGSRPAATAAVWASAAGANAAMDAAAGNIRHSVLRNVPAPA